MSELVEKLRWIGAHSGAVRDAGYSEDLKSGAGLIETLETELRFLKSTLDSNIHYCDGLEAENAVERAYRETSDRERWEAFARADRLEAENKELREALEEMVGEKCDYMRTNNLGNPETQHTVKRARAVLAKRNKDV